MILRMMLDILKVQRFFSLEAQPPSMTRCKDHWLGFSGHWLGFSVSEIYIKISVSPETLYR